MSDYLLASSLPQALQKLNENKISQWRILAGGTDFYPAYDASTVNQNVLDITELVQLKGISLLDGYWRIGALTTWTQLVQWQLPPMFLGLQQTAIEIGAVQIQNVATLMGNVCNASPAADGVPALLALDAEIELQSTSGERRIALADFIIGNRATVCRNDEIAVAIWIASQPDSTYSCFEKLGIRDSLVISIVMVAINLTIRSGTISQARIAVGACSEVATRLVELEQQWLGRHPTKALIDSIGVSSMSVLTPISDIRASAEYRKTAALQLLRTAALRCLQEIADA